MLVNSSPGLSIGPSRQKMGRHIWCKELMHAINCRCLCISTGRKEINITYTCFHMFRVPLYTLAFANVIYKIHSWLSDKFIRCSACAHVVLSELIRSDSPYHTIPSVIETCGQRFLQTYVWVPLRKKTQPCFGQSNLQAASVQPSDFSFQASKRMFRVHKGPALLAPLPYRFGIGNSKPKLVIWECHYLPVCG